MFSLVKLALLLPSVLAVPTVKRAKITDFTDSPIDIAFPPSRGFAAGSADDAPCGGMPLGSRTSYPLSGGDVALVQATNVSSVNILWTSDPDPKRFHGFSSYTNTIAEVGAGHFCTKAPDFGSLGLKEGDNATLLVIYELDDGGEYFYNCADLSLVKADGFTTSAEYVCGNYTSTLEVESSEESLKLTGTEGSGGSSSHGGSSEGGSQGSQGGSEGGSTANAESQSSSNSDSGLSAAAGGGIGAAVTIAVVGLVLAAAWKSGLLNWGKKPVRQEITRDYESTASDSAMRKVQQ